MTINDIVKNVREQLNITQEQLAHELGISFSTINRWENGHTSPSKLAKVRLIGFCYSNNISEEVIYILENL